MATQPPFAFLDGLFERLAGGLQPPAWVVDEAQNRLVLLLNHVLMQEPQARERLTRQAGRVVQAQWRQVTVRLAATPAGLLEVAPPGGAPDLTLMVTEESPLQLAQAALRGDKPPVRIAGDVQFAAEINWLVDNVRWDIEEDLSRLVGDAPAHTIGQVIRQAGEALRRFVAGPLGAGGSVPPAQDAPRQGGA